MRCSRATLPASGIGRAGGCRRARKTICARCSPSALLSPRLIRHGVPPADRARAFGHDHALRHDALCARPPAADRAARPRATQALSRRAYALSRPAVAQYVQRRCRGVLSGGGIELVIPGRHVSAGPRIQRVIHLSLWIPGSLATLAPRNDSMAVEFQDIKTDVAVHYINEPA